MNAHTELSREVSLKLIKIGEEIRKRRQAVEPNYKKFALENNISNMSIWRMENGYNFNMRTFLEVLHAVSISPEDFFKEI